MTFLNMSRRTKKRYTAAITLLGLIAIYNDVFFDDFFSTDYYYSADSNAWLSPNTQYATNRPRHLLQFGDDTEVLGVQFAIFHIPVINTKYNREKFSPAEYTEGISNTCTKMAELGHDGAAHALGDQPYIQSAPGCEFVQAPEVGAYEMEELKYQELSAVSEKHMCRRKFGTDKHEHRRITKEISLVYLNRLEALCDLAETQPDHLTILLDANFDESLWEDVQTVIEMRLNDPTDHSITTSKYPKHEARSWYGREPCQDWTGFPTAKHDFMAVRGKDCKIHRGLYEEWLNDHLEYSKTLMHGVAKGCPCFDDEKVLHYMNVENPGVITFVASHIEEEEEEEHEQEQEEEQKEEVQEVVVEEETNNDAAAVDEEVKQDPEDEDADYQLF